MSKRKNLEQYYQRLAKQFDDEKRWNKMRRFLEGFKPKYLIKIIEYHNLPCADTNQYRCLMKSLRESNLTYQNVWDAITSIKPIGK